jgi:plasmid maintenance system antidote protein VapI
MRTVDAQRELHQFVARYPTQLLAAQALGISPAYLSDLLHGRRDISDQLLAKLGLKRIVVKP